LETVIAHVDELTLEQIPDAIVQLEAEMKIAAKELEFEKAATLRDRIKQLRGKLVGNSSR
jgi:excinuclease ABC subunit B